MDARPADVIGELDKGITNRGTSHRPYHRASMPRLIRAARQRLGRDNRNTTPTACDFLTIHTPRLEKALMLLQGTGALDPTLQFTVGKTSV